LPAAVRYGNKPEVLEPAADRAAQQRHAPIRDGRQIAADDLDVAAGGALLPQQQPQEGRLARTRRPDGPTRKTSSPAPISTVTSSSAGIVASW
jgi:hypothetical protein